ncbi:replication endonuclease [Pandoraea sp. SD6-2]|uniref:replication endonuclease n=1 Tax=Pandoraea sp. SD6-2 TaxID=1286093 RepID=UPI00032E09D0|nr:replication endonuclease [Pandoraea sp. SD6-2]EON15336.1 bacteriophage replication protein [Pandoraea sp. SD6-2]
MWVYARDAAEVLAASPVMGAAAKRLPVKWLKRAADAAHKAGRASAAKANASHLWDASAAETAVRAFLDEHAPESLPVRPDATDAEICAVARRIAIDVQLRTHGLSSADALVVCQHECSTRGVTMPNFDKPADQVARVRCERWWRRRLRTLHIRALEHSNIRLGYVHYGAEPYASNEAVRRRIAQNRRNAATLAAVVLENENGQQFTLEQLAAVGMANKVLRRGELMTRLRGCEDLADAAGMGGVMFTLTCPSRFHAAKHVGGAKFRPNPKYDKRLSPREAQLYLREVWKLIRSKLARMGVTYFGIRVAEPHHDSCPHWHGLIFTDRIDAVCAVMREHALRDSGNEKGAQERRVRFEVIDKARGSAVGYIAKYIAKNIDGHAVGEHKTVEGFAVVPDLLGDEEIVPSQRVETWAAQWGIRQFQQFGGAPVGVWREMRRVKAEDLPDAHEAPAIVAAWHAVQKTDEHRADWAEYCRAMGGIAGEGRAIRIKYTEEMREGRYGLSVVRVPRGVEAAGEWRVRDGICDYAKAGQVFVPATRYEWRVVSRSGEAASTRTRVNNCTRPTGGDVAGFPRCEKPVPWLSDSEMAVIWEREQAVRQPPRT